MMDSMRGSETEPLSNMKREVEVEHCLLDIIMKRALLIFIFLMIFCGCNNNKESSFSNYEHYDLTGKNIIYHSYFDNNNITNRYAIADITPESYESLLYGLFYQISNDDYILIDKIESDQAMEYICKFQEDKLYVLKTGPEDSGNYEYTLNHEKIVKKKLKFEFSRGFIIRNIKDINKDEIYFYALTNDEETDDSIYVDLKCSLSNYKCELNDQQYN